MSEARKWRVLLRRENFVPEVDGAARRLGFYTTRYVEAPDEERAEVAAVTLLRQEGRLRDNVLNEQSNPPMVIAEEIDKLDSFEGIESRSPGLTFYEEEPEAR